MTRSRKGRRQAPLVRPARRDRYLFLSNRAQPVADRTPAAVSAADLPDEETLSRIEKLVRERFVMPGEDPIEAIGPGTPRRVALDAAAAELEAGAKVPSTEWRRRYSLL